MKTKSPRISVNKLAEYMNADVLRRRQIIRDAKYPQKFKDTRYSEARECIKEYIICQYDKSVILNEINELRGKIPETNFQKSDIKNSIDSLFKVLNTDLPDLEDCTIQLFDEVNTLINIDGLDISVYPDIILHSHTTGKIGAIKIHLSKNYDLTEGLVYASTMVKYFFLNGGHEEKDIDDALCISVDVFRMKYSTSPRAYKRTLQRITAACQEIVSIWNTI